MIEPRIGIKQTVKLSLVQKKSRYGHNTAGTSKAHGRVPGTVSAAEMGHRKVATPRLVRGLGMKTWLYSISACRPRCGWAQKWSDSSVNTLGATEVRHENDDMVKGMSHSIC